MGQAFHPSTISRSYGASWAPHGGIFDPEGRDSPEADKSSLRFDTRGKHFSVIFNPHPLVSFLPISAQSLSAVSVEGLPASSVEGLPALILASCFRKMMLLKLKVR